MSSADYAQTPTADPNKWSCEFCTFENDGAGKKVCEMCCKTRTIIGTPTSSPTKPQGRSASPQKPSSPMKPSQPGEAHEWKSAPPSDIHPELSLPSNEGALFRAVVTNHRRSLDTLQTRRQELEQISSVWRSGDVFGALKTMEYAPLDVKADVLTFAAQQFCANSKRNELLTLGAAAIVAPVCAQLLMSDSPKNGIATLCIRYCHAILHGFDQRLQAAVEQGLLEGGAVISNQREAECAKILKAFLKIAEILSAGGQPGGLGAQVAVAATKSNGAEVAEVLARMQSVLAA